MQSNDIRGGIAVSRARFAPPRAMRELDSDGRTPDEVCPPARGRVYHKGGLARFFKRPRRLEPGARPRDVLRYVSTREFDRIAGEMDKAIKARDEAFSDFQRLGKRSPEGRRALRRYEWHDDRVDELHGHLTHHGCSGE